MEKSTSSADIHIFFTFTSLNDGKYAATYYSAICHSKKGYNTIIVEYTANDFLTAQVSKKHRNTEQNIEILKYFRNIAVKIASII